MKKILYVTTIGTSINAFLIPHIKFLIEKGYKVDIATNVDVNINQEIIEKGVEIFNVPFQRNPLSIKNINAFKKIIKVQKEKEYDIVHVHTPVASFITRLALKNEKNLKLIYTCHGFHFYKGSSLLSWLIFYPLEKISAKWTDSLVTINDEDYEIASKFKLRDGGKVSKIHGVGIEKEKYLIENFDKSGYRRQLGVADDDFIILILAEINKNKNHIQLIKAMNLLKHKYPKIKAIFAGVGPLEGKIKKQIKKYDLEDKISLLGWRSDVRELINISDIVGLFSKREGLGKCILEAMICGKCVIATNTRGPRTIIEQNVNGFMVNVDDIQSTAKYIEKIYIDNKLRNSFEKKVITATDKYLMNHVIEELELIYDDLYKLKLECTEINSI